MTFANSRAIVIGAALASLFLASANADPARMLRGSVQGGEQGEPVWIGVFGDDAAEGSWTQANGADFEVALPPGERATLLVVSKNRVPQKLVVGGDSPTTVALRLAPGLALAGTVRSEDGTRLADVEVSIEPAETDGLAVPPRAAPGWRSNRRGEFELGGLRQGRHNVTLTAEGHVPRTLRDVEVRQEGTNRIETELPIAHFISGRVVNGEGEPVADVDVVADARTWSQYPAKTETGSDGTYRLGPFPLGERVGVFARSPGRGATIRHGGVVAPRDGLVLVFRHHAILGRLVDEATGAAVRQFHLTVMGQGEVWKHEVEADDGRFQVPLDEIQLKGVAYALVVQAAGYLPWFTRLTVRDDEAVDLGRIALAPARSVSGRVVDARNGKPIPGARVRGVRPGRHHGFWAHWLSNHSERAVTEADGAFALHVLPLEAVRVIAHADGYRSKATGLPPGVPHLDFELDAEAPAPSVVIAGSIVRADGTPLGGEVALFRAADAASGDVGVTGASIWHYITYEDGQFRFEQKGLPDGAYVLIAGADAGVVARRTVVIEDGQSVEDVRLVVKEGNWLRFSLEGLLPSEGGRVTIRDEKGRLVFDSWFRNGTHRISGVPEKAVVVATASGEGQWRWFARKVRLDDGAEAATHFDFTARSRLTGTVTAGGRPLVGVQFRVLPANPSAPKVLSHTDHQGRYDTYGLAEGLHLVRTPAGHSFEVHVAQETAFDIDLPAVSLVGAVRSAHTGRPVPHAEVRLRRSDGYSDLALTAPDGSFRFDGLVAGEHVVSILEPGFEGLSRKLWIGGDEVVEVDLEEAAGPNGAAWGMRHGGRK